MIKKFKEFNEKILKEELKIITQQKIDISLFDNELSDRETWDLERWSVRRRFDLNEVKEINLYFGIYKYIYNDFNFKLSFGGFGREKIYIKGVIIKYSEFDDQGRKTIGDYFLIKGYITVELGDDKGERNINVKLKSLQDVMIFLDNLEKDIKFEL